MGMFLSLTVCPFVNPELATAWLTCSTFHRSAF